MKKIICTLLASTLLLGMCACSRGNEVLSEVKTVQADSPWWDETVTVVTADEIEEVLGEEPSLLTGDFFFADGESVIMSFVSYTGGLSCLLRKYTFDGELQGEVNFKEYFGNGAMYSFPQTVYSVGGKYYTVINHYDEGIDSTADHIYEIDFENGTLRDPQLLDVPGDENEYPQVQKMTGIGSSLVYLLTLVEDGNTAYRFCVDDGAEVRTYEPAFGSNVELTYIGDMAGMGGGVAFLAEVVDNGIDRMLYCTLDIETFAMECTEVDGSTMYMAQFVPDCGLLACTDSAVVRFDPESGEQTEVLSFADTFIDRNYSETNQNYRVVYASDDKVVLYYADQGIFGRETDSYIMTLTKAPENPNAGKKILTLAPMDILLGPEYYAINEFNRTSDEYFIATTEKYYDILQEGWRSAALEGDTSYITASRAEAADVLASDIREGTGPDLVIYGSGAAQLNNEDLLIDLTPRIAFEQAFADGEYMDMVRIPNGRDGKHYRLDYCFMFNGLVVKNELLDDGAAAGITFAQYEDLISERNRGLTVLYTDQTDLLGQLLQASDALAYDEQGRLSLDNETFRAIAEYVASVQPERESGNIIGGPAGNISQVQGNFILSMISFGYVFDDYSIIGLPSADAHAETVSGLGIGITTCCPLKDAAWEFVMRLMSYDIQSRGFGGSYDPVLISAQRDFLTGYVIEYNRLHAGTYFDNDRP